MAIPDFQILMLPVLKTAAEGARWTRASGSLATRSAILSPK
jgi:hypothetical protein